MNEHTTVSAKQLCTLVFLSLAVDMAVRPFTSGGSAGAQIAILAAVLNTAVVSILLLPVLGLLRREAFTTLKGGVTFGSKALLTLSAVLFAAGGAAAMVRSEAFFRYVSDEPMPQLLVYGLFLLVVFYALRCGLESIVRVLGLAAGLFLLSMALMLVSNLGGMHLSNLTFQPFDFADGRARFYAAAGIAVVLSAEPACKPGEAPAAAQNAGAAVRILYRTDVLLRGGFGYESAAAAADHPYAFTSGQHFCIPPSGCSAHCCVDAGGAV